MWFPYSYFEDEVRCGFYVPSIIKHAWASQIEVLNEITKVCQRHQITYFAECGTLLGAVRHGGFIPWDDDLDIAMKREDYNRFIAIAPKELPEEYSVLNIHSEVEFDEMFTRVVNSRTIRTDENFLIKNHGFPFVSGVDIFVLDYLPKEENEKNYMRSLYDLTLKCASVLKNDVASEMEMEGEIAQLEEFCGVKLNRNRPLVNELYLLAEKISSMYHEYESDELTDVSIWVNNPNYKTFKSYYRETTLIPFETVEIPVPAEYDAVLRYRYGLSYMVPIKQWNTHEYPFFMNQLALASGKCNVLPWEYKISSEKVQKNYADRLHIGNTPKKDSEVRRKIVFLPYKPETWKAMESVWRAATEDTNCDVYVVPIPYYDKNVDGSFIEVHYDIERYPEYVPITRCDMFDFEGLHPDVIVIQNPYDEYNYATEVIPFFYSQNLKRYTDELVYIPYFTLDEIKPGNERELAHVQYFITMPGVVNADKVVVQSENMKQIYVDTLTKAAGEDTRQIWEQKIVGLGSPLFDEKINISKDDLPMPDEWKRAFQKKDGKWKKVILYCTSTNVLLSYPEQTLNKMKRTLDVFQEYKEEVGVLWLTYPLTEIKPKTLSKQIWNEYQELVKQYQKNSDGIYAESGDEELAIAVCDAYFGEASYIAQRCKEEAKPVMLQNIFCIE